MHNDLDKVLSSNGVEEENEFKQGEQEKRESTSEDAKGSHAKSSYLQILYGFQSRGSYKHASKNCEIVGGMSYLGYGLVSMKEMYK